MGVVETPMVAWPGRVMAAMPEAVTSHAVWAWAAAHPWAVVVAVAVAVWVRGWPAGSPGRWRSRWR